MPCDACPVPAGRPCLGTIHPPACEDVRRGRPGRAAQLVALSGLGGDPTVDPGPAPAPPPVDPRLAIRADTCPHGTGPCGCGAEPRLCGHPDRPAEVWRPACLRCVAATEWEGSGTIA